jgi:hypothetical protein
LSLLIIKAVDQNGADLAARRRQKSATNDGAHTDSMIIRPAS